MRGVGGEVAATRGRRVERGKGDGKEWRRGRR